MNTPPPSHAVAARMWIVVSVSEIPWWNANTAPSSCEATSLEDIHPAIDRDAVRVRGTVPG
jgi:hypothetical protein